LDPSASIINTQSHVPIKSTGPAILPSGAFRQRQANKFLIAAHRATILNEDDANNGLPCTSPSHGQPQNKNGSCYRGMFACFHGQDKIQRM